MTPSEKSNLQINLDRVNAILKNIQSFPKEDKDMYWTSTILELTFTKEELQTELNKSLLAS